MNIVVCFYYHMSGGKRGLSGEENLVINLGGRGSAIDLEGKKRKDPRESKIQFQSPA